MNSQAIAQTILAQLGGNRFAAMTGAKNFLRLDSGLQFDIPRANGIRKVRVELNGNDLYDVTFYKVLGVNVSPVAELQDLYADQLQSNFTEQTGLYTRLS
jgi:hypothetical protein